MQFILADKYHLYNHNYSPENDYGHLLATEWGYALSLKPFSRVFPCLQHNLHHIHLLTPTSYSFSLSRCHPRIGPTPYYLLATNDKHVHVYFCAHWWSWTPFCQANSPTSLRQTLKTPQRKLIVVRLLAETELFNNYFFILGWDMHGGGGRWEAGSQSLLWRRLRSV